MAYDSTKFSSVMKRYAIHITISSVAVVLAIGHLVFPEAQIDAVTLTLLAIAGLPWLGSIFKAVELPGGLKVEYQELTKAGEEAERAGLLVGPTVRVEVPTYAALAETDPNLALAGLRIELEKRLRAISQTHGIRAERQGISQLLRELRGLDVLSSQQQAVLADLIGLLNQAVHGAEVDSNGARWAVDVGSRLLASLETRAK